MIRFNPIFFAAVTIASSGGCKDKASLAHLPENTASTTNRAVRVVQVEIKEVQDAIQANGTTAPKATTKIMPLVPGLIKVLPVGEGDLVKKGQVLAVIDQRSYKLSMRQAEAAVEQAQVALDATTREKKRFQQLMQEDATAKAQLDQVMDRWRGAEVAVKQAQVARDMAKKALVDTTIRAPYSGVVIQKLASLGDYATSMPPTVILVIMDISTLDLKVSLPEPELTRVTEGALLEAMFKSVNKTIKAKIHRVIRSIDPMTRSFEVIAEIPNPTLELKPGLFADVTISTSTPRRKMLLPSQAIIDEGAGIFSVFVNQHGTARRVEVKLVTSNQDQSEILAGLQGNEQVILEASGLLDGDAIKVQVQEQKPQPVLGAEAAR